MNPERTPQPGEGGALDKGFQPMRAVWEQTEPKADDKVLTSAGFSSNYRGEATSKNASANISDAENTSLWLTNLPADCGYDMLLSVVALHRPGKIFASHINPPCGQYATAAAKLVFFTHAAAVRLYRVGRSAAGLVIGGRRVRVGWNQIKTAAYSGHALHSRVVYMMGPADIVNRPILEGLFRNHFVYDTQRVEEAASGQEGTVVWYFGSFRAQSQSAVMLLDREYKDVVRAYYGADPCGN